MTKMFPESFRERYLLQSTPKPSYYNLKRERPIVNEWSLAITGLILSLVVITGKVLVANWDTLRQIVVENRLVASEVVEDGQIFYQYAWTNVVRYSNIWLPLLCGGLTTYFTWMMVYLDSHVPGVQPPSPFSPNKYKAKSGHSFHLNYIFAVLMGILITSYMYWRGANIQY